jgi:hypothetical protein
MDREKELNSIIKKARSELGYIEDDKRVRARTPMVGKYFKSRNSYGTGTGEGWWHYAAIRSIDEGGNLYGFTFQIIPGGRIEVEMNTIIYPDPETETSPEDFWDVFNHLTGLITQLVNP